MRFSKSTKLACLPILMAAIATCVASGTPWTATAQTVGDTVVDAQWQVFFQKVNNEQHCWQWNGKKVGNQIERRVYSPHDGEPILVYQAQLGNCDAVSMPMIGDRVPELNVIGAVRDVDATTRNAKKVFLAAGLAHDANYGAPWEQAGFREDVGKALCDQLFFDQMLQISRKYSGPTLAMCNIISQTWFDGLTIYAFDEAVGSYRGSQKDRAEEGATILGKGGAVMIYNRGAYIQANRVTYTSRSGRRVSIEQDCKDGRWSVTPLTIGATDIEVVCWARGGSEIFRQRMDRPGQYVWKVDGTTLIHNATCLSFKPNPVEASARPERDIELDKPWPRLAEAGDKFQASLTRYTNESKVKLTLKSANNITWWKGLNIYINGQNMGQLYTQDDRHSSSAEITVNPNDLYEIEFCKAKGLGEHRAIKRHSIDLYSCKGKALAITWVRD